MNIKKDLVFTVLFIILGMSVMFLLNFDQESFYLNNPTPKFLNIFLNNLVIYMLVLFLPKPYKSIVYYYNITFMGMFLYIMIFYIKGTTYFFAPLEFFTLIYIYTYASYKNKKIHIFIIIALLIVSALIESRFII